MKKIILNICFLIILPACLALPIKAQPDAAIFTYQGSLKDNGVPANGNYEIKLEYFDAAAGGDLLGSITFTTVAVVNGIFSLSMTGSTGWMFPGRGVWIQTSVRPTGSSSPSTILAPRQRIASAPFAISSLLSADSQRLGGIEANQYLTTTSGASTFIQNGTTQQLGSFNLDGTGTANIFNAATQFSIGGNRILSGGNDNIFAGFGAGQSNTTGGSNSFFGVQAGGGNLTGNFNSFFGKFSGFGNISGGANSFFGASSGQNNSSGGNNAFFGDSSGLSNTVGGGNTLLGVGANVTLNNLTNATAIGFRAAVGQSNSLVLGGINGINNSLVDTNVGIGTITPTQRLQVVGNAVFSGNLGIGLTAPTFKFQVNDTSNTGLRVVTNTAGGTVASFGGFGAFQIDAPGTAGGRLTILENGNVGIGNNAPTTKFQVSGNGLFTGTLTANGNGIFSSNVGIGNTNPTERLQVTGNGLLTGRLTVNGGINYFDTSGNANFFMKSAGAANGINFGVVGVAGTNSVLYISQYDGTAYQDRLVIDTFGVVKMPRNVVVGTDPNVDQLYVNGFVSMNLGTFGTQAVCRNTAVGVLTLCSSSIRYKQNVKDYKPGLELIRRLRPVSFNWKVTDDADFGLVAEEVAEIEPLMIIRNDKGETEGVKYDRVGVVLVNAVNEQQDQIEAQQKQLDEQKPQMEVQQKQLASQAELIRQQQERLDKQQTEIDALKALVCANKATAGICREKKP
jgi:hypothetical protein